MTTSHWTDFNDADLQQGGFDLIPRGTIVPVYMTIKRGGHDDPSKNWTGGYATQSYATGSVYLAAEFVITAGPYAKRRLWTNIGLYSSKGPAWGDMGRSFIRAALNSARGIMPRDASAQAVAARRITGIADLDGLAFLARIDTERDGKGQERNVVRQAIEPGHPEYATHMASVGTGRFPTLAPSPIAAQQAHGAGTGAMTGAGNPSGKPAWAQ